MTITNEQMLERLEPRIDALRCDIAELNTNLAVLAAMFKVHCDKHDKPLNDHLQDHKALPRTLSAIVGIIATIISILTVYVMGIINR